MPRTSRESAEQDGLPTRLVERHRKRPVRGWRLEPDHRLPLLGVALAHGHDHTQEAGQGRAYGTPTASLVTHRSEGRTGPPNFLDCFETGQMSSARRPFEFGREPATMPAMQLELFDDDPKRSTRRELAPGAWWLGGFAIELQADLHRIVADLARRAPFRQMKTPGGREMSVAMTNCGAWGWITDRRGYRYEPMDPDTGHAWPTMPNTFADLAARAAADCGFAEFEPDACLINRYEPGARMTPHRDVDERDFAHPIVSVSLGLPAVFRWGGPARKDPMQRVPLSSGDVVVFGGPARRCYHGVLPVRPGDHPIFGAQRINLTFRRAR